MQCTVCSCTAVPSSQTSESGSDVPANAKLMRERQREGRGGAAGVAGGSRAQEREREKTNTRAGEMEYSRVRGRERGREGEREGGRKRLREGEREALEGGSRSPREKRASERDAHTRFWRTRICVQDVFVSQIICAWDSACVMVSNCSTISPSIPLTIH